MISFCIFRHSNFKLQLKINIGKHGVGGVVGGGGQEEEEEEGQEKISQQADQVAQEENGI